MKPTIHGWRAWGLGALWLAAAGAAGAAGAETAAGWRGDGTGRYPAADPPVTWARTSVEMQGLRFLAEQPPAAPGISPGSSAGTPMADGVVREWLVAGPVAAQAGQAEDAPDEAAGLKPEVGAEIGGRRWERARVETAYLDFRGMGEKAPAGDGEAAAYAYTNLYTPTGGKFRLNLTYGGKVQLYVNGKKPGGGVGGRTTLDLGKGWNRLLIRVARGEGDWYVAPVLHGADAGAGAGAYSEKGIAWRTALPGVWAGFYGGGTGVGAPVVAGENLYVLSEPHDVICLRKRDGKVLWIRRAGPFEAATEAERQQPAYAEPAAVAAKLDAFNAALVGPADAPGNPGVTAAQQQEKAKLEKDLQKAMKQVDRKRYGIGTTPDVGFAGTTPATDGQRIYAWFTDGVSACFTLGGERRWVRADPHAEVEHGFSSSPLLVDGKFVVFMRDLMAFDAETGKLAWQTPLVSPTGMNPGDWFWGSLVAGDVGGTKAIVLPTGTMVRAGDGKVLYKDTRSTNQAVASAVVEERKVYLLTGGSMELVIRTLPEAATNELKLPTRAIVVDTKAFPKHYLPWHLASPVVHEGLAYLLNNAGVLTVLDVETDKVVYQKLMDLDVFQTHNEGAARGVGISVALAGKHIYLFGNNGAALVLEPGRVFKQVAKNKIESVTMRGHWSERQERFMANPVFEGKRMYVRGEEFLYAVEEMGGRAPQ